MLIDVTTSRTSYDRATKGLTHDRRSIGLHKDAVYVASSELKDVQGRLRESKKSLQPQLSALAGKHAQEAMVLKTESGEAEKLMAGLEQRENRIKDTIILSQVQLSPHTYKCYFTGNPEGIITARNPSRSGSFNSNFPLCSLL